MSVVTEVDARETPDIYIACDKFGDDHRVLFENTYIVLTEDQMQTLMHELIDYLD